MPTLKGRLRCCILKCTLSHVRSGVTEQPQHRTLMQDSENVIKVYLSAPEKEHAMRGQLTGEWKGKAWKKNQTSSGPERGTELGET